MTINNKVKLSILETTRNSLMIMVVTPRLGTKKWQLGGGRSHPRFIACQCGPYLAWRKGHKRTSMCWGEKEWVTVESKKDQKSTTKKASPSLKATCVHITELLTGPGKFTPVCSHHRATHRTRQVHTHFSYLPFAFEENWKFINQSDFLSCLKAKTTHSNTVWHWVSMLYMWTCALKCWKKRAIKTGDSLCYQENIFSSVCGQRWCFY